MRVREDEADDGAPGSVRVQRSDHRDAGVATASSNDSQVKSTVSYHPFPYHIGRMVFVSLRQVLVLSYSQNLSPSRDRGQNSEMAVCPMCYHLSNPGRPSCVNHHSFGSLVHGVGRETLAFD